MEHGSEIDLRLIRVSSVLIRGSLFGSSSMRRFLSHSRTHTRTHTSRDSRLRRTSCSSSATTRAGPTTASWATSTSRRRTSTSSPPRGCVFKRGYVPSSLCRASLATMITGLYPHQHKITSNDPPIPKGLTNAQAKKDPGFLETAPGDDRATSRRCRRCRDCWRRRATSASRPGSGGRGTPAAAAASPRA